MIKKISILFALIFTTLVSAQADFPEGIYSGAGVVVDGQVKSNATNPVAPNDLTRKDYVDSKAINFIKSNEALSGAKRKDNTLYGILDQFTGEEITLNKINSLPVGMLIDNVIYFQLGSEYFKRQYTNGINLKWFGVTPNNTPSQIAERILKAIASTTPEETFDGYFGDDGLYITDPIKIPPFITGTGRRKVIRLRGKNKPSPKFGTVAPQTLTDTGVILQCLSEVEGESLIYCTGNPTGGPFGFGFSDILFSVEDLELRTYQNSKINALHAGWAAQFTCKNLQITNGVYSVNAIEPTYETAGLITPYKLNGALTILDNIAISGFRYGLEVNEHTDGRGLNITCNYYGLRIMEADHASYFGLVDAQRNRYAIKVDGVQTIEIAQLNLEHAGVGQTTPENIWQATVTDIYDPLNKGRGVIKWASTMGGVGLDPNGFSRDGGNRYKYVNLYETSTSTPSGYDGGGYRFEPSTFNSASRRWEIRNDINTFGDFGFRYFNTGTNAWINALRLDLDSNIYSEGVINTTKYIRAGSTPTPISGTTTGTAIVVTEPSINAFQLENKSTSNAADLRLAIKSDDASYLGLSHSSSTNTSVLLGIPKNTSSFIFSVARALTLGTNSANSVNIATNNVVRFIIDGSGKGSFTNPLTVPIGVASTDAVNKGQLDAAIAAATPVLKTVNGNSLTGSGDVSVGDLKQNGNAFGTTYVYGNTDNNSNVGIQNNTPYITTNNTETTLSRTKINISGDMYLAGTTSGIKKADGTNYIVDGIVNVSANTSITNSNFGGNQTLVVYVNASAGNITMTLPALNDMAGRTLTIIKTDATANTVTLQGATNINQYSNQVLYGRDAFIILKSDGTQNRMVDRSMQTTNPATVGMSSAQLNTQYPNVPVGFRVICGGIALGGAVYTKYSENGTTDVWLMTSAPVQM